MSRVLHIPSLKPVEKHGDNVDKPNEILISRHWDASLTVRPTAHGGAPHDAL